MNEMEHDLSKFICPISKIKAIQVLDTLNKGETARIILGDGDSLKSVAQELKTRGIVLKFTQEGESRFVLTVAP